MSQDSTETGFKERDEKVQRFLSGSAVEITGAYRKSSQSSYSLNIRVQEKGKIVFEEEYDYYPRDDDDGRTYVYGLTVPGDHFDAVLKLLQNKCHHADGLDAQQPLVYLLQLLTQLVREGQLVDAKEAGIFQKNLQQLGDWLAEAE